MGPIFTVSGHDTIRKKFDIEEVPHKRVTSFEELQIGDVVECSGVFEDFFPGKATVSGLVTHQTNERQFLLQRHDGKGWNAVDTQTMHIIGESFWHVEKKEAHYLTIVGIDKNEMAKRKTKVLPKQTEFNPKELDAVVLDKEVRDEIEAVLKQHKHAGKIFDEWGLGSVIEYGRGMTFLFYGPPGTGKTWTAHCIARALGKELLILSASDIQTSEPGGANRNIQQAFATAKNDKKILFLDECDSIITNRSDVGMILSSEINTLLTEIEKFEGVCILATNRIETLDEALERRISLIVEFPEPDFPKREKIWERMLPKKMPVGDKVTPKKLAESKLTGGQIKNAVLQAARLALAGESKEVSLAHFESAIERIHKSKSLMGNSSRYKQIRVREDFKKNIE